MSKGRSLFACALLVSSAVVVASETVAADTHDIVIYGSTPAAIAAAVQAKRSGKSVVVVSPETRIGGMTTGGLGQTDGANLSCYGGIAREFYRAVKAHYDKPESWTRQKKEDYHGFAWARKESADADTMWTFEPSAALAILEGWEKRDGLEIVRGERLDRGSGKVKVEGEQRKIVSFVTESGREFCGKVFIDATYEGDLMAAAGVSYTVGREGNDVYGETVNGIQRTTCGKGHRFVAKVDPYVEKGNPSSGLLKYVERDVPEPDGMGDRRVQAYCFRLCLTADPENRVPFEKPEGYDERDYELAFRDFEGRSTGMVWLNPPMPNLKSDCNSGGAVSLDFIGGSDRWPEASYAERERIFAAHVKWQKGILWTYANHPRIPGELRREVSRWGLAKDEFAESGNWPTQLYVREGRRMVGECVITENDCTRRRITPKPVLRASFNMDAHNVRRVVGADGFVFNEGDVQAPPLPPFHLVPYGALTPKRGECANLLVPVCLSASHVAYGSIRMEPMFFGLGQVAALAAVCALDDGVAVQDVSYAALRRDLDAAGVPSGDPVPTFIRRLERKIPQKVVCYGTSLTEGGSWVGKMLAELERRYPGLVEVVNSGRGGQNSNYGVSYLKTQVLELKPDAVFIEFAMNDAVTRFNVSVEKARANLENMIGRIRAELPGAEIILQTMNPYAGEDATKRPCLDDYYNMYREVAAREGLLLVDHNRVWKDLLHEDPVRYRRLVPDGTHPNARGTDEVIMPTLLRILTVRE